ncbi:MAG: glutamate 5-kinase [Phycisphaerae bacterium]|nr:glutamate 5-kinase [Phycisphaerae bacterium]
MSITAKTVVVKLGSALLAPGGRLSESALNQLACDVAAMAMRGRRFVIVSSGAIASGFRALGLAAMPRTIVQKQAAAAVGQQRLMAVWSAAFAAHGLTVAQILLTAEDLDARDRMVNARRTFGELLARGIVPIVNENDTVSYAEIKLGDNDRLSALVAGLIQADLLLILSGVEGLHAGGPRGPVIPRVGSISEARTHIAPEKSAVGTGGMETKIAAAEIAGRAGIPMVIAGGRVDRVISRVLSGEEVGTWFPPLGVRQSARKRWLGMAARPRGTILVDQGAEKAVASRGASILPGGITDVRGEFAGGSTVDIATESGGVFARGITAYSSTEVRRIMGRPSAKIALVLGFSHSEEVIHRNDLVVIRARAEKSGEPA